MKKILLSFAILGLLIAVSCKENKVLGPEKTISRLDADFQGLHNLGNGFWYELWVLYDGGAQSAGVFTVDDNGAMTTTGFNVNMGYLQLAKGILLTIEEDDVPGMYFKIKQVTQDSSVIDTVMAPSAYRILAGTVAANDADLSVGNEFLLDYDFLTASGTYLLNTPTDSNAVNPKRGLWFVNKDSNGTVIQGLDLPVLPSNWVYQGWVNSSGNMLYSGSFQNPAAGDAQALFSDSTGAAYPFPGEDFIFPDTVSTVLPNDLTGLEIGVSIIPPCPEKANVPFDLVVLKATIPGNAVADHVYELQNNAQSFPEEQVHISIKLYE